MNEMTRWLVVLDFRMDVPSFEVTVDAKTKNEAVLLAEQAAVAAGWADAELRKVTCYPQVEWVA